jgi:hypothetical protein
LKKPGRIRSGAMTTKRQYFSSCLLQCCSIVLQHGCAATLMGPVKSPNFQRFPVSPTSNFGLGNHPPFHDGDLDRTAEAILETGGQATY